MKEYDLIAIGGGSGGVATARRAAEYGARVLLIEAARLGGTCVNVGCVPKKVMWYASGIAQALRDAPGYGFADVAGSLDWATLKQRRDAYIERLNGVYAGMLEKSGVELRRGFARFAGPHVVEVEGERFTAPHIVISTGGRPALPDLPGAELGIDSDGFFALEAQPRRVAVVGAGYIAVELAGVFRGLGSEVSMLVRGDRLLRPFDAMLRDELAAQMQEDGIALRFGTQARALRRQADGSVLVDCGEAGGLEDAGGADQAVQRSGGGRPLQGIGEGGPVAHIDRDRQRCRCARRHDRRTGAVQGERVPVEQAERRALTGQLQRHGTTDAGGGSGHDNAACGGGHTMIVREGLPTLCADLVDGHRRPQGCSARVSVSSGRGIAASIIGLPSLPIRRWLEKDNPWAQAVWTASLR